MPYFLLAIGFFLLLYGGYLLKKENNVQGEGFHELLEEQNRDREEYIKLLAGNQDLKGRLDSVETKLDYITGKMDLLHKSQPDCLDCGGAANQIDTVKNKKLPMEGNTEPSLNMGKGEVRFIQNLLKKVRG